MYQVEYKQSDKGKAYSSNKIILALSNEETGKNGKAGNENNP
jgi:hypothetical protein